MLVEGEQGAEARGVEVVEHKGVGAVVARCGAMRVLVRPAKGHGLALAEAVGQQPAVVVGQFRPRRLVAVQTGKNQVGAEGTGALVQHLMEGVLPRGAFPAPNHGYGMDASVGAVMAGAFAVALGLQLLQIGREAPKAMVVGQHGVIGDAEKVDVPDVDQRRQQRRVGFGRRLTEVLVHGVGAVQERLEAGFAESEGDRRADRRPQREPSPHPVPQGEDVLWPQAPGCGGLRSGGDGDELGGHRLGLVGALQQPIARRRCVGQGLQGGEGFGDDDEQRGFRVRIG